MDITQFTVFLFTMGGFFLTVVGLFIWNRTESRTDMRHLETLLTSQRSLVDAIRQDGQQFRTAMMEETKDFHKRLCEIEAKK